MNKNILTTDIKELFNISKVTGIPEIPENEIFNLEKHDQDWSKYINLIKKSSIKCRLLSSDLKILAIADTHGAVSANKWLLNGLKDYSTTEFDIVVFLGDIPTDDLRLLIKFVSGKIIIGVLGNHDTYKTFEDLPITNMHSRMLVTENNIWLAGLQGSIRYNTNESSPMLTHKGSIKAINNFWPADILFTHDVYYDSNPKNTDYCHKGLAGITEYIYRSRVPLHIHGHTHQRTIDKLSNGTTSIGVYGASIIKVSEGKITCHNVE